MVGKNGWMGDIWGGSAAMLVALPSAIAFGVIVYGSVGGEYSAYGAIAGILGVIAVGTVTALLGGTNRLISAPSAPAAAVLSAFALEYSAMGMESGTVFVMLMLLAAAAGLAQIVFGAVGLGKLIKYMPFPVVSGYLSGVGLYIIASQAPKFLGLPPGESFWQGAINLFMWEWQSIIVGSITVMAMLASGRYVRFVPAVIVALAFGIGTYFLLGTFDPHLREPNNPFVIGAMGGSGGIDVSALLVGRFELLGSVSWHEASFLVFPALTLAALLSIDTLKTCVFLDSMTHSFHRSDRELMAQGSGNLLSALIGGMPGSGTMGPTMINLSAGAVGPRSGLVMGMASVIAFWMLGNYIAWIPHAVLSGILIVIGFRMIDRHSIRLLRSSKTALDFAIILTVAVTAVLVSLIAAAGVGLVLAVALYIFRQIGASVVYRRMDGTEARSKIVRNREEEAVLREKGALFSVYELHGSLFFGTANQLYSMLQHDLEEKKYVIMDMKRVQTVDLTAAHILLQIKDILHDRDGYLLLCRLPHKLPTGDDMESYFNQVGLLRHLSPIKVFDDLEDAVEWAEERIIAESISEKQGERTLELEEFELLKGRNADTIEEIRGLLESRSFREGEQIFAEGDGEGKLYLIRRGSVRITLKVSEKHRIHISTLVQGSFFGEYAFLEGSPHYTDASAASDTELYAIGRDAFEQFAQHHKKASYQFMLSLARVLSERLREADLELVAEYDV